VSTAGEAAPAPPGGASPSKPAADALITVVLVLAAIAVVASVRGTLATIEARMKETSDVYVLPPPEDVVTLSLGYRAALADYLWSHVLVSQGLHTMERRRFDNLTRLLDTINELDPQFRDPYLLTDALVTFQTVETPHDEVVKAREIMERGVKNRPLDAELWLVLGQFVGFIAPGSYLTDPQEIASWRSAGAQYLARAAELGGEDASISWAALGGAGILGRSGDRDAQIRFYQRTLAVTDDEELKEKARTFLAKLLGEEQAEAQRRRALDFEALRRGDLPTVRKTMMLLLGPPRDPAWCAGTAHVKELACSHTWKEWAERRAAPK
jgi:hypothetical protein